MSERIRAVARGDAAALCAIYNPYIRESIATFEEVPLSAEDMARRIDELDARYPWLCLDDGEQLLGYAYGAAWKQRSAYGDAVEVSVYLATDAVGRGRGSLLLQALLRELALRGFHAVLAGISLPNPASVALHEKLGFRKVGQLVQVGYKFGAWVDVGYWQLVLVEKQGNL